MYENGAIYKTPDGKTIVLLFLHGDVFCLLEVVNGILNIVRAEKWEYSKSELPRRLEDFEFIEGSHLSVQTPMRVVPKPVETPKVEAPVRSRFERKKK
jgi:hypothetical protein